MLLKSVPALSLLSSINNTKNNMLSSDGDLLQRQKS